MIRAVLRTGPANHYSLVALDADLPLAFAVGAVKILSGRVATVWAETVFLAGLKLAIHRHAVIEQEALTVECAAVWELGEVV